jgi:hypothetical protein
MELGVVYGLWNTPDEFENQAKKWSRTDEITKQRNHSTTPKKQEATTDSCNKGSTPTRPLPFFSLNYKRNCLQQTIETKRILGWFEV